MYANAPIAIVGLGGVFPRAMTPAALWDNVVRGVDAVRDVPAGRWILDPADVLGDGVHPDTVRHGRAAYVDGFSLDSRGLKRGSVELSSLDPLYHFVLHAGRDAFEDARVREGLRARAGVVLAAIALPTDGSSAWTRAVLGAEIERSLREKIESGSHAENDGGARANHVATAEPHAACDSANPLNMQVTSLPAALLARALGLGGETMTLDAACASSLYAVKLACDELRGGRADLMLAGGVSRPECLYTQMGFGLLGALSPRGTCRPFDAEADGLIVGEGCGVVVLRRLEDALRDGQNIYGVIRGIGLSNDVAGSLLAADSEGQLRAMRSAYAEAGLAPSDMDYVECHGTGTPQGDAMELRSLAALLDEIATPVGGAAPRELRIGSIKSQIGHLLTAAGAAGLIKTLLGMRAGVLPPQINFDRFGRGVTPHPRLRVQTEAEPWTQRDQSCPRRAAISAFGFGGINAHLLVEEYLPGVEHVVRGSRSEPPRAASARATATPESAAPAARDEVAGEDYVPPAFRRARPTVVDSGVHVAERGETAEPIAIVGVAAHVGGAESLRAFERALLGEASEVAPDKLNHGRTQGDVAPRTGGRIESLDVPIGAFKLPPSEIPEILPQQTLMLMAAANAMDDAARGRSETPADARDRNMADVAVRSGALISMSLDPNTSNYHLRWWQLALARHIAAEQGLQLDETELRQWVQSLRAACGPPLSAVRVLGSLGSTIASRVAREFGFGGPSFALSAGAASGLRAVEIAAEMLRRGETDLMLVGAVDLCCDPRTIAARPGAAGDGACAVVLRRLSDAERDGDRIYAVVGETADELPANASARGNANLRTFEADRSRLGDCGAAAGLIDVVAALLAIDNRLIPSSATGDAPDTSPAGADAGRRPTPWLRNRALGSRRALVRAASDDATSVSLLLEEPPDRTLRPPRRSNENGSSAAFAVFGENAAALRLSLTDLRKRAAAAGGNLHSIAAQWQFEHARQRRGSPLALTLVTESAPALLTSIDHAVESLERRPNEAIRGQGNVWYSPEPLHDASIAFVYPGSGSHYDGMGRELVLAWPEVIEAMDAESGHLADQFAACGWADALTAAATIGAPTSSSAGPGPLGTDVCRTIIAQVSFGILMTDILERIGIRPRAALGYSLGETTSLFALRAWRDRDRMFERMRSSPLFRWQLTGACEAARRAWGEPDESRIDWHVVVVNRDASQVRPVVASRPRAYLLIVNAPGECVIGGAREDVQGVVTDLGCQAAPVEGASTVHCPIVRQVERAYRDLHRLPVTAPENVRFYSAAAGGAHELNEESAAHSITDQALRGFDFTRLVERAYDDGLRVFIEVGPQSACTRMIGKILAGRPHLALSGSDPADEPAGVVRLAAALVAERILPDFGRLHAEAAAYAPDGIDLSRAHGADATRSNAPPKRVVRVPAHPPRIDPPAPPRTAMSQAPPTPHTSTESNEVSSQRRANPPAPTRTRAEAVVMPSEPWVPGQTQLAWPDDAALRAQLVASAEATGAAHEAYLHFTQQSMQATAQLIAGQLRLLESLDGAEFAPSLVAPPDAAEKAATPCVFDREQCLEFARGSAARVLGPMFAELDSFAVRVRLPDEPLMLVDRITALQGEAGSLSSGTIITEHDVLPGAWYLDGGRMPVCVTVEAGQADLFLCSYLGIDLRVRGTRAYRLLDATVRFFRELPRPNEVLRYDIAIDRFVRQGDAWLFFFRFDATIAGRPLMSMRNGCAGFFTEEEIENSRGIVLGSTDLGSTDLRAVHSSAADLRGLDADDPVQRTGQERFERSCHLIPVECETYDEPALDALRRGDLAACFGAAFANLGLRRPLGLPDGRMRLLHRVVELDPRGGRWGLGRVVGEADIHPDDWFLTCHFVDDMVMPGTLMFECCAHTLRVLMLRYGWVGENAEAGYEPLPERRCVLKCRGPVTPATRVVTYEVHVKEIGYWSREQAIADGVSPEAAQLVAEGEPYVVADAWMYADGKRIVQFTDMSLRVSGVTRSSLEALWSRARRHQVEPERCARELHTTSSSARPSETTIVPIGDTPLSLAPKPALYDHDRILAFSIGRPSDAFGEPYRIFDESRRVARLPGPPYLVLDRITEIHAPAMRLEAGGWIEAQYDIPHDAWYFASNRQRSMPFAILLEIALQPCGWFAAYLGSALRSETDLRFRNLGGSATLHREVFADSGTLTTRVRITDVSEAGGMIIENFDMQVWRGREIVYEGDTYFGFFSDAALANQVGVRGTAGRRLGAPGAANLENFSFSLVASQHTIDATLGVGAERQLPDATLRMIDEIDALALAGGPHGLGFVRGRMTVDAEAWFFKAHFYQDPVVPGSLGCESFLQLLKVYALRRWGASGAVQGSRFELITLGARHEWTYRGQIVPRNRVVEVEAAVTRVEEGEARGVFADGFVIADGTVIYELKNFGVRLVRADRGGAA